MKDTQRQQRPIRLGLVSYDFKNHPTSHMLLRLLAPLRAINSTEIYAYALNNYSVCADVCVYVRCVCVCMCMYVRDVPLSIFS